MSDGLDIVKAIHESRDAIGRIAAQAGMKRLARLVAYYGVRNSRLEDLHVEHISDPEMRDLMLSVEHEIGDYLGWLVLHGVIQITNADFSPFALGDWHGILARGPSYDLDDPPAH